MRRQFDTIRGLRESEEPKSQPRIRISRSPSPFKNQNFPTLEPPSKPKREPSVVKVFEAENQRKGYLAIHQEKQASKQTGFFLVKKKEKPNDNLINHDAIFDTPRFGDQATRSDDLIKLNINSGSTTCQSIDLITWVGQTQHQKTDLKANHGLTFADRVESSCLNLLPLTIKRAQGDSSKPKIPIKRFLLPSIEPMRGEGGARHFSEDRLSRSLDFRPQSDGRSAPKIVIKKSEKLQNSNQKKLLKNLAKPFDLRTAGKNQPNEGNVELNKHSFQRKGGYIGYESLNTPPSFGCIDNFFKDSSEELMKLDLEGNHSPKNFDKIKSGSLFTSICLELEATK